MFAVRGENGISFCIAGACGMDPWFQERGFTTTVSEEINRAGYASLPPELFFGTDKPFFRSGYGPEFGYRDISVDDAIAALKKAIASFDGSSMSAEAPAASPPLAS